MQLNNHLVPDHELLVSMSTSFASESLGGETSSTASAHKGIKPKEISASFLVRFKDSSLLTQFYAVAESTDNGDLTVYTITDRTANAAGIRQVQFAGTLETREILDKEAWRVSFRLREYLSVPEKTEARANVQTTTASPPGADEVAEEEAPAPTGFEKVLASIEARLGD